MSNGINYGKHSIDQDDIDSVIRVLKSDYLTQGPEVANFENNFAQYVSAPFACAVNNGTAALHLGLMALGLRPGQKVITTPLTFAASANAVLYCGATVLFCDINPETFLMDEEQLAKILSDHEDVVGILPVAFAGLPNNLEKLRSLADKHQCWILEDACHAPGAQFTNSDGELIKTGSGQYADCSVFSFHPVKHIATGEGGMVTTGNKDIHRKLKLLRSHGITKAPEELQSQEMPAWYHEMQTLGFNYRLSDILAALGSSQLTKASSSLDKRVQLALRYQQAFDLMGHKYQKSPPGSYNAYHLFVLLHPKRDELYQYLREHEIYTQVHYIPAHLHPYYKNLNPQVPSLPHVEKYYQQCLSLPLYPTLSTEQQDRVIQLIKDF